MKYYLAIDQGTTSSRAVLYDESFQAIASGQKSFPQHFPKADWVEHDLEEIWESVEVSIEQMIAQAKAQVAGFRAEHIRAIGITNQRETFGLWERTSGAPVHRAIVWQCRRSAKICEALKKSKAARNIARKAGLVLDPYFSGSKLRWLFENKPELAGRAKRGELAFGTMDTFLVSRLSGGKSHVTDPSNASRTMLMDLESSKWNPAALKLFRVPAGLLPEIVDSNSLFGATLGLRSLPDGIPIHGVLGDQQAALFGQQCFEVGQCKATYGTGAFFLMNVGKKLKLPKAGLLTTAWKVSGRTTYAIEGAVFIAGAAVQWLRDGLKMISNSKEIESIAKEVPDSDGVFFVPALTGLGSPHWVPGARGLLGGLTRRTTRGHLARATLEGIAHSVCDLVESLAESSGTRPKVLRVDGGAAENETLLLAQSRLLGIRLERPADVETTARGAAMMAALGVGDQTLPSLGALESRRFKVEGVLKGSDRKKLRLLWKRRVQACVDLAVY